MTTLTAYTIGSLADIPSGEGRAYEVGGRRVAIFHTRRGAVYALEAACPHRGGPLADGLVGGAVVVCPLHGWKFDLATGTTSNGACAAQAYETFITELGEVAVLLPDSS